MYTHIHIRTIYKVSLYTCTNMKYTYIPWVKVRWFRWMDSWIPHVIIHSGLSKYMDAWMHSFHGARLCNHMSDPYPKDLKQVHTLTYKCLVLNGIKQSVDYNDTPACICLHSQIHLQMQPLHLYMCIWNTYACMYVFVCVSMHCKCMYMCTYSKHHLL